MHSTAGLRVFLSMLGVAPSLYASDKVNTGGCNSWTPVGLSAKGHSRYRWLNLDRRTTERMLEAVFRSYRAEVPLFSSAGQFTMTFNGWGLSEGVLMRNR